MDAQHGCTGCAPYLDFLKDAYPADWKELKTHQAVR
jgi:hypothetical protein